MCRVSLFWFLMTLFGKILFSARIRFPPTQEIFLRQLSDARAGLISMNG